MLLTKNNKLPRRQKQQGVVLLVALVMTVMFVLIGITIAERSKTGTEVTGSTVRYQVVFEGAEQSLRDAMLFIQSIRNGEPVASNDGTQGRNIAADFRLSQISDQGSALVSDPSTSFIWAEGALENVVCTVTACPAGINFMDYMDSGIWDTYAIKSDLATNAANGSVSQVDANNHILNTRTYTFIQLLKKSGSEGSLGTSGSLSSEQSGGNYYLITVKASGYPPNTVISNDNARENVIIQAVFAQKS